MVLNDRIVMITGATGGLGSVLFRDLAALGASFALVDIDSNRLEKLVREIDLPSSRYLLHTVDLLDPEATRKAVEEITTHFGRIDILLHVVGGWTGGKSLIEAPRTDLEFMINQHIWTSFNVIQAVVPGMLPRGWGRIIMITSPYAARPHPRGGPYAIGKAGQESLMLTLAQELKGTGVTANLLQAKTIDVRREKVSTPSPDNASWTTPEELSAAVQYLLTDPAAALNGARIPMYGSYN